MSGAVGFLLRGFGPVAGAIPDPGTGTSTHEGAMLATQARIRALIADGVLSEIEQDDVVVRLTPYAKDFGTNKTYALPAVLIFPGPLEKMDAATNKADDIGYPVVVAIMDASNAIDDATARNKYLHWREILGLEFRRAPLVSIAPATTFFDCIEEPGPIVDWRAFAADGKVVSSMTFRFFTRQARGN